MDIQTIEHQIATVDVPYAKALELAERYSRVMAAQAAAEAAMKVADAFLVELNTTTQAYVDTLRLPAGAKYSLDLPTRHLRVEWDGPRDLGLAFRSVETDPGTTPLNLMDALDVPDLSETLSAQIAEISGRLDSSQPQAEVANSAHTSDSEPTG